MAFFRDSSYEAQTSTGIRSKAIRVVRTLGRVGPWGIGFLVWEMYGPGLS